MVALTRPCASRPIDVPISGLLTARPILRVLWCASESLVGSLVLFLLHRNVASISSSAPRPISQHLCAPLVSPPDHLDARTRMLLQSASPSSPHLWSARPNCKPRHEYQRGAKGNAEPGHLVLLLLTDESEGGEKDHNTITYFLLSLGIVVSSSETVAWCTLASSQFGWADRGKRASAAECSSTTRLLDAIERRCFSVQDEGAQRRALIACRARARGRADGPCTSIQ